MATRRVVTGIDNDGKSYAVHDGPTTGTMDMGLMVSDDVWVDDPSSPIREQIATRSRVSTR